MQLQAMGREQRIGRAGRQVAYPHHPGVLGVGSSVVGHHG